MGRGIKRGRRRGKCTGKGVGEDVRRRGVRRETEGREDRERKVGGEGMG